MKLTVTDYTGTISSNPAYWPDQLKQAVAKCCCGDTSSVPPNIPTYPIACCPSVVLPPTLNANLRNTLGHDGGHSLKYYEDPLIPWLANGGDFFSAPRSSGPSWIPTEGHYQPIWQASLDRILPSSGWYSDLIADDCQNGVVHFEGTTNATSVFDPYFISSSWVLDYTYKVYYYIWFGGNILQAGTWKASCSGVIVQLCYPVGTLTTTVYYRNNGRPTSFTTIYVISYHDQVLNGGAGGISVPYPGIAGTLTGGSNALNNPYSISGVWQAPGFFFQLVPGNYGDVVCDPFKIRLLLFADYIKNAGDKIGKVSNFTYGCGTPQVMPHPFFDAAIGVNLKGQTAVGLGEVGIPDNAETGVTINDIGNAHTAAQISALPLLEVFV